MPRTDGSIKIENTRLVFRNFRGAEDRYNPAGTISFGAVIPAELALQLKEDGWNPKQFNRRPDDDPEMEPEWWLPIKAKYDHPRPPRIVIVTTKGRRTIPEDEVETLDAYEIQTVDLIVRPFPWTNPRGDTGISAYLQTMYVTIVEDELDEKYADIPEQS
jgi:hypothetical protein